MLALFGASKTPEKQQNLSAQKASFLSLKKQRILELRNVEFFLYYQGLQRCGRWDFKRAKNSKNKRKNKRKNTLEIIRSNIEETIEE